jgi:hypothetical protein
MTAGPAPTPAAAAAYCGPPGAGLSRGNGRRRFHRMETKMRFPLAVLILLLAGIGTAMADIRIDVSRYHGGNLIIIGSTEPNSTVTLDGKYNTKSDGNGIFKFTEHYKPDTCMSDIRAGSAVYSAVISGCLDPGFDGETMPMQTHASQK